LPSADAREGSSPVASDATDPVEAALAVGIAAIASSMAAAAPCDLVHLADWMAALAAELRARREAKATNVIPLDTRRRPVETFTDEPRNPRSTRGATRRSLVDLAGCGWDALYMHRDESGDSWHESTHEDEDSAG
jgi:hypothetical protein